MTATDTPVCAPLDVLERRVLFRDLIDWTHRLGAVLPPISPRILASRRVSLNVVLDGIGAGMADIDDGHAVRAAVWLLEQGYAAEPRLSEGIRAQHSAAAALAFLRRDGVQAWQDVICTAVTNGALASTAPLAR